MSRIELKHIDKFYGSNHVLRDINLTIEDGDFMTLLGPSGCGKTTTLRVVSGLEKPQNGTMTIDGVEMINADDAYYAEPSKRGLNLVFQSYALWPHMTVYDNIAFGLKIQKMSKAEIDRRVMDSLRMMRIDMYKDRYPAELSGGQQQRVAIARAVASEPQGAAVGRAAVQLGRQAAHRYAFGDETAAPGAGNYHHLRDPRPGRGIDHVHQDRDVQGGRAESGGHAHGDLQEPHPLSGSGGLYRQSPHQPAGRQGRGYQRPAGG